MGSTGSGSFTDYSGSQSSSNGKSSGGDGGGASGTDRCLQAFSCALEEVAQCEFYSINKTAPPTKSQLNIVLKGRIFAVDKAGNTVGALPTAYNYLAGCLADGIAYVGVVTTSSSSPVPAVTADFSTE
jgi:hypothetical protein